MTRANMDRDSNRKTGRTWEHAEKCDTWRDGYKAGRTEAMRWCWQRASEEARAVIEAEMSRKHLGGAPCSLNR